MLKHILPLPGIYKITSPTGKLYIGRSINIKKRLGEHKNKSNTLIGRSIEKHGYENHVFDVLAYTVNDNELLNELEIYFIKKFDTTNRSIGLNLSAGGGRLNFKHTDETLEKMRKNRAGWRNSIGRKLSDETKAKISRSLTGQKIHDSTINKIKMTAIDNGISKMFLDLNTGVYYYSERDLANHSEFSSRNDLRKKIKNSKRYVCC